jgi:hypothetical protein
VRFVVRALTSSSGQRSATSSRCPRRTNACTIDRFWIGLDCVLQKRPQEMATYRNALRNAIDQRLAIDSLYPPRERSFFLRVIATNVYISHIDLLRFLLIYGRCRCRRRRSGGGGGRCRFTISSVVMTMRASMMRSRLFVTVCPRAAGSKSDKQIPLKHRNVCLHSMLVISTITVIVIISVGEIFVVVIVVVIDVVVVAILSDEQLRNRRLSERTTEKHNNRKSNNFASN